ncbi:MAG: chemotaxis-specific protein-glutamate methyltransferase CheB [Anaerolineae bacterium]|nr:chemotaxis-specific protein-glutamate methyltransferase CheB [Anaerolineae bacterium]
MPLPTNLKSHGDIRAIVVDDSPTARELLVAVLQVAEGIRVIGVGASGADAVRLTRRMRPDVLLMDINMPQMDGLEATRQIMADLPTPIVLITGTLMRSDLDLSFEAIRAGALTVLSKPGLDDPESCEQIVQSVRTMAGVPLVRRWTPKPATPEKNPLAGIAPTAGAQPRRALSNLPLLPEESRRAFRVVAIASSTGGPAALATILRALPSDFPVPILIVQHVTQGFASGLAEWLDSETKLRVQLAAHGAELRPGAALIAPDGYHLQVNFRGVVELSKEEPYRGLRPSANYLFHSLARVFGARAMGIILTGMGDDGAEGMLALHRSGGFTIAQDEQSCVIFSMPREAIIRDAVDVTLAPDEIAHLLGHWSDPSTVAANRISV